MRAFDIYNKAKDEILAFAKNQFENIRDWYIQIGLWDKKIDDWDYYQIDPSDYNLSISVMVDVTDTYTLDTWMERRKVNYIRLYDDGVALELEGDEKPYYLRGLSLWYIAEITDYLEMIWNSLMGRKEK